MSQRVLVVSLLSSLIVGAACIDADSDRASVAAVVQTAEARGLTPYWLGSSFAASGVEFLNSEGEFADGVLGERVSNIELAYFAQKDGSTFGRLDVDTMLADEWPGAEERLLAVQTSVTRVSRGTAHVAGRGASIYSVFFGAELNQVVLAVRFGDMMVVASTTGSAEDAEPDPNPLMNERTFLSVLQELRPYPE